MAKKTKTEIINDQQVQIDELNDKYLRLLAEFDNFRKRNEKIKIELVSKSKENVILQFLYIVDDFERALKSITSSENTEEIKKGIELIYSKLNNTLSSIGVQKIDTDQDFNPDLHEAITMIGDDTKHIKECIQSGYTLDGRTIRASKVIVG